MATIPTAEQSAREILAIFLSNTGCRPNEVLNFSNIQVNWNLRGLSADDLKNGLDCAVKKNWIELLTEPNSALKITDDGFNKA